MKFTVMFVLILLVSIGAPEVIAAPSLLGICHKTWDCDATVKLYDGQDKLVLSWLENTFNRDCKCAQRLLNDARPKIVRVHIANSPCMRNKRCGRYEVLYGQTAASASREFIRGKGISVTRFVEVLNRLKTRLDNISNLTCYVSPCLECDLNGKARRIMADMVSAALPYCNIVDNPYRQRCLRGITCEKHGDKPGVSQPCIVDLDGTDGSTIDVKKWVEEYKDCDLTYYWEPWMNCIQGDFIDPRKRNCSYDSSIFESTKGILCQYFYPLLDTCSR